MVTGTRAWPGGSADTGESAGYGAFSRNVRRGPDPSTPGYSPGRSYTGSGYDPGTMRSAEGTGAAGQIVEEELEDAGLVELEVGGEGHAGLELKALAIYL